MGPFGASHYSLSFFVPFHPKLPPSEGGAPPPPGAASLGNAWKGLGLTYMLLKGLKKTSKTLKLIRDSVEGYSKKDLPAGTGGNSSTDKGMSRSLSVKNPVGVRPVTSQNPVGYGLRKISRGAGQVSSHTRACKSDMVGLCRGDNKDMAADSREAFSDYEAAAASQAQGRFSTEKSFRDFGLGLEGVMTTITGLSQQVHYKNEMKEIITVVKTADRVVEGVKAAKGVLQTFSSPFGDALIGLGVGNGVVLGVNTVKIVLKGVKISKGLVTVTKLCKNKQTGAIGAGAEAAIKSNQNILGQRFKVIVKGLKASEGAANVVTISKEVGKTLGMMDKAEFFTWSVMMKGFKFTKSAIRVLEPLGGIHWGVISAVGKGIVEIKGAVEGIGVVVKAIVLSKELYVVLLKGGGVTKGAMAAFNAFNRRSLLSNQNQNPEEPVDRTNQGTTEGESLQTTRVRFIHRLRQQATYMPLKALKLCNKSKFVITRCKYIAPPLFIETDAIRPELFSEISDAAPSPLPVLTLAGCLYSDTSSDSSDQSHFSLYSMGLFSRPQ